MVSNLSRVTKLNQSNQDLNVGLGDSQTTNPYGFQEKEYSSSLHKSFKTVHCIWGLVLLLLEYLLVFQFLQGKEKINFYLFAIVSYWWQDGS